MEMAVNLSDLRFCRAQEIDNRCPVFKCVFCTI